MKKNILMLSALFLSITALAQTDVTTGVMRGKDYGVTYMLPKTEIEIVLQATKHTYTPGEFCRYADRLSASQQRVCRTRGVLDTG